MTTLNKEERIALAERRLRKVLRDNVVSSGRTLEQKISDAGPGPMRVDPHVLHEARSRLEAQGVIKRIQADGFRWYTLTATNEASIQAKLAKLRPVHAGLTQPTFRKRMGQTLEIATYRALVETEEKKLHTLGCFLDLNEHDDSILYKKEEPPSSISGRTSSGKLDFIVVGEDSNMAGIEVKNIREWIYPNRSEVMDLLDKCTSLDIVPVLIARRIPFVTFKLLNTCGAIVHQIYNQLFPDADFELAEQVKDKQLLGYHDVRCGNLPDARLKKFIGTNLPNLISTQRSAFEDYKDLLRAFGTGDMPYAEFAGRVRRRAAGLQEDSDWQENDGQDDYYL